MATITHVHTHGFSRGRMVRGGGDGGGSGGGGGGVGGTWGSGKVYFLSF